MSLVIWSNRSPGVHFFSSLGPISFFFRYSLGYTRGPCFTYSGLSFVPYNTKVALIISPSWPTLLDCHKYSRTWLYCLYHELNDCNKSNSHSYIPSLSQWESISLLDSLPMCGPTWKASHQILSRIDPAFLGLAMLSLFLFNTDPNSLVTNLGAN